jgi:hypothetical protein
VTQPLSWADRKLAAQVTADLLRAPPLDQQLGDEFTQQRIGLDAAQMEAAATRGCQPVCLERQIAPPAARVAAQFPRNR